MNEKELSQCTHGPVAATVNECAQIVAAEYQYWRDHADKTAAADIGVMTATGALANVLCAINGFQPWHPKPETPSAKSNPLAEAGHYDMRVELTLERDQLRTALSRYGHHDDNCPQHESKSAITATNPCTCGFDKVPHWKET